MLLPQGRCARYDRDERCAAQRERSAQMELRSLRSHRVIILPLVASSPYPGGLRPALQPHELQQSHGQWSFSITAAAAAMAAHVRRALQRFASVAREEKRSDVHAIKHGKPTRTTAIAHEASSGQYAFAVRSKLQIGVAAQTSQQLGTLALITA
eukprot:5648-Heterococcus_DN1.PRE.1